MLDSTVYESIFLTFHECLAAKFAKAENTRPHYAVLQPVLAGAITTATTTTTTTTEFVA